MIIALPSNHDHLANALVRDLGFSRVHVDQSLRDLALALDPYVTTEQVIANMGRSPRLSSKLQEADGDWGKAIKRTPEIGRLLDVLSESAAVKATMHLVDTVIVGVDTIPQLSVALDAEAQYVAIEGRNDGLGVHHYIPEGGVLDHEAAIVNYVRSLREPVRVKNAIVGEPDDDGTYGGHGSGTHVAAIIGGGDDWTELGPNQRIVRVPNGDVAIIGPAVATPTMPDIPPGQST